MVSIIHLYVLGLQESRKHAFELSLSLHDLSVANGVLVDHVGHIIEFDFEPCVHFSNSFV